MVTISDVGEALISSKYVNDDSTETLYTVKTVYSLNFVMDTIQPVFYILIKLEDIRDIDMQRVCWAPKCGWYIIAL